MFNYKLIKKPDFLTLIGAALALCLGNSVVNAAEQDAADVVKDEILIITATKRKASLQEVPMSVTALWGGDLEDQMVYDMTDYAETVPGLSLQANDPGNNKVIIRGISTDSYNGQLQSTVGVYIDDMPGVDVFIPTSSPDLHMFDVNRIEVLRGPQGTLWGSSSLGGAIRVITNKADPNEAEFRARLTGAAIEEGSIDKGFDAVVNVPLVADTLGLRFTAYNRVDGGYMDAPNQGKTNVNKVTVSGARASLLWEASDDLQVELTSTYQQIEADDGGPSVVMTNSFSAESQAWLDQGIAFCSINYHGSITLGKEFENSIMGCPGKFEVEDIAAAHNWLIQNKIAQPEAIFLTGNSYGGYLTLQALGRRPELWAGGMAGVAIADWDMMYYDQNDALRGFQKGLFGGTPDEKPEAYKESSPITYTEQVQAPILVIQGRNDTRCPVNQMLAYEAKMKALGKQIHIHWFEAGHWAHSQQEQIDLQELKLNFVQNLLK